MFFSFFTFDVDDVKFIFVLYSLSCFIAQADWETSPCIKKQNQLIQSDEKHAWFMTLSCIGLLTVNYTFRLNVWCIMSSLCTVHFI